MDSRLPGDTVAAYEEQAKMLDALGHHALGFDHLCEDDRRYVVSTAPTAPRATSDKARP
jgi:hypothetical protein